ncbi:MAG: hypothetical protein WD604_06760 [Balneolaceae bacterium]
MQRRRTINYYLISGDNKITDRTLFEHLKSAHKKFRTVKDRTFVYKDGSFVKCLSDKTKDKYMLIHLCRYEPNAPSSTIPAHEVDKDLKVGESSGVKEIDPPKGRDYLDSDLFALISEDIVLSCSSGLSFSGFRTYIQNILTRHEDERIAISFKFLKSANEEKIEYIRNNKVKSITLSSPIDYHQAQTITQKNDNITSRDKLVEFINDFFGNKKISLQEVENYQNLHAALTLKFDTRKKSNQSLFEPLNQLAEGIVEDDSVYYEMKLKNNDRVRSDEIIKKKTIDVPKFGNSIKKEDVWDALASEFLKYKNNELE